jgi:GNAT superfamily N-acetyltransferase
MCEEVTGTGKVRYCISPSVSNDELNSLFAASWDDRSSRDFDFGPVLRRSLACVCAYHAERLIGFVNVAWDGGVHAFLLDTTVHPDYRRRGIGRRLVEQAIALARDKGLAWMHVGFEPNLREFYSQCGFRVTEAGLVHLQS